jgi:transcriptional regulator with XRE-family HTH domain
MAARRQEAGAGRARRQPVEEDVGRRLRAHREERQLSLRELARRLSISPSAISQIETGKSRPSVSTLYAIVSELGMSLDELFSDANRAGASAPERTPAHRVRPPQLTDVDAGAARHVQRKGSRRAVDLESGVRWERLTPNADAQADFLFVTYDVGGSSSKGGQFIRHSGREYGLVLSGTLEVTVGFDRYELGPGDSICFDSTVPHCLRNVGSEPVLGVWFVIGRQSDQGALAFEHDMPGAIKR